MPVKYYLITYEILDLDTQEVITTKCVEKDVVLSKFKREKLHEYLELTGHQCRCRVLKCTEQKYKVRRKRFAYHCPHKSNFYD